MIKREKIKAKQIALTTGLGSLSYTLKERQISSDFLYTQSKHGTHKDQFANPQKHVRSTECSVAPQIIRNIQIFARKSQGNTYWIGWSFGPRGKMNAWHRHNNWETRRLIMILVGFSLFSFSLSRSQSLVPRNGQCLCARQNFNEGGRRWQM